MAVAAPPRNLANLWHLHKRDCRHYGEIIRDARAGVLPGVKENPTGYGYIVVDEAAALSAIRKPLNA